MVIAVQIAHLLGHARLAVNQIVGQQYRERLIIHRRLRAQHGMAKAERFGLANVDAVDVDRQHAAQLFQHTQFALGFQFDLKLIRFIEMIGDGTFAASNNENQVGDTRRGSFFRRILNQRLIDDRQHFLGIGLGCRQKAGAETGGGKNSFRDAFHYVLSPCEISS